MTKISFCFATKRKNERKKKKDFCFMFHPFFDTKNGVNCTKLFSLTNSVGNQTFFTKSKILEKAVSQAQNDVLAYYPFENYY